MFKTPELLRFYGTYLRNVNIGALLPDKEIIKCICFEPATLKYAKSFWVLGHNSKVLKISKNFHPINQQVSNLTTETLTLEIEVLPFTCP